MRIAQTEWIGKTANVVSASNKSLVGLSGVVVDETHNLVLLATALGNRTIQKNAAVFGIAGEIVAGSDCLCAPQERIKVN